MPMESDLNQDLSEPVLTPAHRYTSTTHLFPIIALLY